MAELSEAESVRRLADRFGFGAGGDGLAALQQRGYDSAVEALLSPDGTDGGVQATPAPRLEIPARPAGGKEADRADRKEFRRQLKAQQLTLTAWWLDRMVQADQPLRERLTWFWHGHFATSVQKVRLAPLMLRQNQTLRSAAVGSFTDLARALIVDPAMLIWLDGNDNTAKAPNENLGREFMELFALGHGHYSETDVKEAARSLTGWKVNRQTGQAMLRAKQHDDGDKTVLGQTGALGAEDLVAVLLDQPASAEFVIGRLWFRLVSVAGPGVATTEKLLAAYGSRGDIVATLRAVSVAPEFRDPGTSMVKQPVEWLVGTARALGLTPSELPDKARRRLLVGLRGMGQVPFRPPSVGGWPAGAGWLTTASTAARLATARVLAAEADLSTIRQASTKSRTEAVRRLLGVDAFTARTADAISQVAARPADAVALAAVSPEYVVSR